MINTIGILGAGAIGKVLARHFGDAGYTVFITNSRGPDSLLEVAASLGKNVNAASPADAVAADIVVLSIPWAKLEGALGHFPDWKNKIVIDTTNHILSVTPEFKLADIGSRPSSEIVSGLMPGARVVKAFNTLYYKDLERSPVEYPGNRVIIMSGDDVEAKNVVKELISGTGFWPVDIGNAAQGGKLQQPGGALSSINLVRRNPQMSSGPDVVKRNTEEVQGNGDFHVFEEIFADDYVDHTPQAGGFTPDKKGTKALYQKLREAFPDFHADIHWQISDGDRVTTFKTYHGTHLGEFAGVPPTKKEIQFETVDVMRVRDGKITDHWGVGNLLSLMRQLGAVPEPASQVKPN